MGPSVGTQVVLERQLAEGLHAGAVLVASVGGERVVDLAVGEARPGVPMTTGPVVPWFSMSKTTVAVRAAMAWEAGLLELDDLVADHLPAFAGGGKERVTVRHLLTHTGGFRGADASTGLADWDEETARICATPLEDGWVPGRTAGYSLRAGFHVLAEVVRSVLGDGRPWAQVVADDVFAPLGMTGSHLVVDPAGFEAEVARSAALWATPPAHAEPRQLPDTPERLARCQPGASGRGPVTDLQKLGECLLFGGAPLLSATTVEAITARHRTGLPDKTFAAVLDWGLGLIVDAKVHGKPERVVPYGYGAHATPRTFGHGGSQTSGLLCDPDAGLVAVMWCSGMPGEPAHAKRAHEVWTTLYEDLGLT